MGLTQLTLSPAQDSAAGYLLSAIPAADVLVLRADAGMGRTTILRELHAAQGGVIVGVREFMSHLMTRHPAAIEEAFLDLLDTALANDDLVFVDDLHLIKNVVEGCEYPRPSLLYAVLTTILDEACRQRKKLLFAVDGDDAPWQVRHRAVSCEIGKFTPDDYHSICRSYLGDEAAARLSYGEIHRFAPLLSVHQLKNACSWLKRETAPDTDSFIEYLKTQNLASNVDIEEVAAVDWKDLKGMDDVIQALESKIALPFENHALAAELRLKPKRGVLLAGPPGTGKTTIGRALAHRLKGKFFLIDGTAIAGTSDFYREVRQVFEAAKRNAPSVIFIDDTDVIFEGKEDRGLYRYLLTMLDGLESASADRVCVMMTAMDVSMLPPALLRSGRLELWLETRLPDAEARSAIISEKLAGLPPPINAADVSMIVAATHGLTGADLKAVIEDGKLLFAHDRATGIPLRAVEEYFIAAIDTVRANRRNYARRKPLEFMETVKIGFSTD